MIGQDWMLKTLASHILLLEQSRVVLCLSRKLMQLQQVANADVIRTQLTGTSNSAHMHDIKIITIKVYNE